MSQVEKTCENCKYEQEAADGEHCRHCIQNSMMEEMFEANVCEWEEDIYGWWHTQCNVLADNSPLEYTYCPYCGKKIMDRS